jgi:hypothetical protein
VKSRKQGEVFAWVFSTRWACCCTSVLGQALERALAQQSTHKQKARRIWRAL